MRIPPPPHTLSLLNRSLLQVVTQLRASNSSRIACFLHVGIHVQCRLFPRFDENLMTQIKNAERSSPTLAERARVAHQRPRPWKTAAHAVSPRTFALCIAIYGLGVRCDDVETLWLPS